MKAKSRKFKFLLLFISLLVLTCIVGLITENYVNGYFPAKIRNVKYILFWNTMFGNRTFFFGEHDIFKDCPVSNCVATYDRSFMNVENFHAILFHGIDSEFHTFDLPERRRLGQKYIFVALESPSNRKVIKSESFFNRTMTYMLGSDILWPYGYTETLDKETVAPSTEVRWVDVFSKNVEYSSQEKILLLNKSKLAIWFSSNCNTQGAREFYVKELEKHMPVNKFGECSTVPGCPREKNCFRDVVEPEYFFYLSFENSLCDDYVTEKLFNALRHYVVPVVYGGANYSRFAPPGSYINALDFDTPKELAEHLVNLAKNLDEYKKYFNWKKFYRVVSVAHRTICELCRMLHTDNSTKSYSISDWYNAKRSCKLQENLEIQRRLEGPLYATRKTLNLSKPID